MLFQISNIKRIDKDVNEHLEKEFVNPKEDLYMSYYDDIWSHLKRKKKREQVHLDYYNFRSENKSSTGINSILKDKQESENELETENIFEEDKLNDIEYLKKRKQMLKLTFKNKSIQKSETSIKDKYM